MSKIQNPSNLLIHNCPLIWMRIAYPGLDSIPENPCRTANHLESNSSIRKNRPQHPEASTAYSIWPRSVNSTWIWNPNGKVIRYKASNHNLWFFHTLSRHWNMEFLRIKTKSNIISFDNNEPKTWFTKDWNLKKCLQNTGKAESFEKSAWLYFTFTKKKFLLAYLNRFESWLFSTNHLVSDSNLQISRNYLIFLCFIAVVDAILLIIKYKP